MATEKQKSLCSAVDKERRSNMHLASNVMQNKPAEFAFTSISRHADGKGRISGSDATVRSALASLQYSWQKLTIKASLNCGYRKNLFENPA